MSNFVVSSLKYRPKDFDSVVGQDHVTKTLKNSIIENKIPSALLFCGPRGVGKTSCARIYAKEINSESVQNLENPDYSFNIFEIDAASNNKTDDIRDLIEKVRIPPQIGKYKVYIIDEVHMLSKQAENAFLKTLEEPPPHIVFILATTEKNKILPTILSRCQIYDFNRIKDSEINNCLKDICKKEGFEFEDEAVSIISRKSDGSLRDSLTILDRIVSFTNKNITTEKTSALLNILDNESYLNISKNIFEKDLISSIISFNKICEKGFNEKDFLTGLASHFRNILISKSNESHSLFEFSSEIMNSFIEQGNMISNSELVDHITIVESSIFKYNQVENKKLLVEITLMKLCKVNQSNQINDKTVEKKKDDLGKSIQDSKIEKNELRQKINTKIDTKREKIKDLNIDSEIEPKKIENPEISALSLSSLKLKKEVNIKKEKEKENKIPLENRFDLDALKLYWKKYSKNLSEKGNNSLSSLMEISEPSIFEENKILFYVPSKSNKKEIDLDRENICDFLKSNLKNDQIVLEVNIDESMNKEYYSTPQEKFDKLNEINPILNEFKKDLKLDL
tara:strand:+ start:232 stop:1929 length:1698 start_codon:yes stop_codon:yes gene_type:complete